MDAMKRQEAKENQLFNFSKTMIMNEALHFVDAVHDRLTEVHRDWDCRILATRRKQVQTKARKREKERPDQARAFALTFFASTSLSDRLSGTQSPCTVNEHRSTSESRQDERDQEVRTLLIMRTFILG